MCCYWGQIIGVSFFVSFMEKLLGMKVSRPKKNGNFSRKLLYTLIFERQKTQHTHTHNDIDLNKSQLRS